MTVLHHRIHGEGGETLVLLGSLGSTTDMWLPQLDALSHDFRVIALDHRGHGTSPVVEGPATMADLAADVLETLDGLGVGRFHVAGLSLGGCIAQLLAAESDRVQSAALLCTAADFGPAQGWHDRAAVARREGTGALADAIVERWFSPSFLEERPATTAHYRAMIAATPGEGYAACCEALADWDFTARLPEITVPVLTIAGADDPASPPETLRVIADGVADGRAAVLTPAGHLPTIERAGEVTGLLRGHVLGAAG
ncbi:3-oxoadipate enol-lactonase [Corynebacterium sp. 335C]